MSDNKLNIVICGLSITSSWGNGHATTYRALVRELTRMGHQVLFLEREVPWYAANRDLPAPPWGQTRLYDNLEDLAETWGADIQQADVVIIGSYVPHGVALIKWILEHALGLLVFYDIDTPVTMRKLANGDYEYLAPELISRFDLYLSFTGGPILQHIEKEYQCPMVRPLYCCVDPEIYQPEEMTRKWDLGYLGTYSPDQQVGLERTLLQAARQWENGRFIVAGPQYPATLAWPQNVDRQEHLPPEKHREFYNTQRFTLNLTRAEMLRAGYAPSVRLFEAAACGTPIISDFWAGIDQFFEIGREILMADSAAMVLEYLQEMPEEQRQEIGRRARERVLSAHTAAHRAAELVLYLQEAANNTARLKLAGAR